MNKQQYNIAHHLIRLFRYEQTLKDVFHYPIGFDCPCGGRDDCEWCAEEDASRAAAYQALQEVRKEIALSQQRLGGAVDRESFKLVASTIKPNWSVHQKHIFLGEGFQAMIRPVVYGDKDRLFESAKARLLNWWNRYGRNDDTDSQIFAVNLHELDRALKSSGSL